MDNIDVVLAQNCSKTLRFVNELTSAVVKVVDDSVKGLANNNNNAELVAVVSLKIDARETQGRRKGDARETQGRLVYNGIQGGNNWYTRG